MLEYLSISQRQPEFPSYLNFQTLRAIGINHLQTLSGQLWTDYNLHDPGVTILEVLCYAVTDLGYRNNFDIEDLLALNPADAQQRENNFFTADEILTCNPVTDLDLRKRLIDIPGVRNAWLEKSTTDEPTIFVNYANSKLQFTPPVGQDSVTRLHPRGLYDVYIDLDGGYRKNACGELYRPWSEILDRVKAVLSNYRNLCEDIHEILVLGKEEIALCSDIELKADADAEDVLVEIYVRIQALLSPHLRFYTLQELLDQGKSPADIFAGRPTVQHDHPYSSHGFIDTAELEALTPPTVIYTSDLYQEILKVPGVTAIRRLSIVNYLNGLPQAQHPWHLHLTKGYSPQLTVEFSKVKFFTGVFPLAINADEVKRRYAEQQAAHIKAFREAADLDLPVPQGSYYKLADHYSIQHDFPLTYGISADGLPETASRLRKAQARQLKGYLVFFDQLLANYLAQLAQVRDLFSWEMDEATMAHKTAIARSPDRRQTYFTQGLHFPDDPAILGDGLAYLHAIQEDPETYRDRRSRFLDHLLGRFAESFADYVVLNYRMFQKHRDKVEHETKIIHDKAHFLQDYPTLSRDRFRAFNYGNTNAVWNTENVAGFKKRVSRLLGIEDVQRRDLCPYRLLPSAWSLAFSGHATALFLESSQIYATSAEAEAARDQILLFGLHADFYRRFVDRYDDGTQQLTTYGYVLVDHQGQVLAASLDRWPTAADREVALQRWFSQIQVNQAEFQLTVEPGGGEAANAAYYFKLKNNAGGETLFQSVKPEATALLAWQAAAAWAEHLRNRNRYVAPVKDPAGNSYPLGIMDQAGQLLAIAPTAPDPEAIFQRLNSVEPFLLIDAVIAPRAGYRWRLIDRGGVTLLQSAQLCDAPTIAHDRFYQDVLGILFEAGAIDPTGTKDNFGFRIWQRPRDPKSVVAMHPETYRTAADRDAVINRLFLLIRTARLSIKLEQRHNIGQIYDQDGPILLQSQRSDDQIQAAWQHGNYLLEQAQKATNFRLIEGEHDLWGWALSAAGQPPILATHYYPSAAQRDRAINALQARVNDEGFHVLEHILLRPRTVSDNFLPIVVNADDAIAQGGAPPQLTCQDPYSFWISVVLPYWPDRFRDMDFRRFVERTLRLEAPAHVALKIAWLDGRKMSEFEVAYHDWLEQLAGDFAGSACDRSGALNRLLAIIPQLRSVYPQGYVSGAQTAQAQPIILNQTALGNAND